MLTENDDHEPETHALHPRPGRAPRLTISVEEAGQLLGISRGLAYVLVSRGDIPSIRLGRRIVVPRRALDQLLDIPNDAIDPATLRAVGLPAPAARSTARHRHTPRPPGVA